MKKNVETRTWRMCAKFTLLPIAFLTAFTVPAHSVTSISDEPALVVATDSVYMTADELPAFPGGDMALGEWLRVNLKYPEKCKKEGVSGRVIVRFVVNKNGRVAEVEAIRSPHPELAKAAVRTVKKMPKWIPGKKDGQVVRCVMNLPIMYKWNK